MIEYIKLFMELSYRAVPFAVVIYVVYRYLHWCRRFDRLLNQLEFALSQSSGDLAVGAFASVAMRYCNLINGKSADWQILSDSQYGELSGYGLRIINACKDKNEQEVLKAMIAFIGFYRAICHYPFAQIKKSPREFINTIFCVK